MLLTCVGAAVDMARAQVLQSRMQMALDVAGIATSQLMSTCFANTTSTNTTITSGTQTNCLSSNGYNITGCASGNTIQTCMNAQAQKYFNANFPVGYMGASAMTVTPVLSSYGSTITLNTSTTQKTTIMEVANISSLNVAAATTVSMGTPDACSSEACVYIADAAKKSVVVLNGDVGSVNFGQYLYSLDQNGPFCDSSDSNIASCIVSTPRSGINSPQGVTVNPKNDLLESDPCTWQANESCGGTIYTYARSTGAPVTHTDHGEEAQYTAINVSYGSTAQSLQYYILDSNGSNGGNGFNVYLEQSPINPTSAGGWQSKCQMPATNGQGCTGWLGAGNLWGVSSDANSVWVTDLCDNTVYAYSNMPNYNASASPVCGNGSVGTLPLSSVVTASNSIVEGGGATGGLPSLGTIRAPQGQTVVFQLEHSYFDQEITQSNHPTQDICTLPAFPLSVCAKATPTVNYDQYTTVTTTSASNCTAAGDTVLRPSACTGPQETSQVVVPPNDGHYKKSVNYYCYNSNIPTTYYACNGQFNQPWGVARDAHGNFWVTDRNNNRVQEFDASGNYMKTIPASAGACAPQVVVPNSVNPSVAGTTTVNPSIETSTQANTPGSGQTTHTYTYAGDTQTVSYLITVCGSVATASSAPGQFDHPEGITATQDANGQVYIWVTDSGNGRVEVFADDGSTNAAAFLQSIGSGYLAVGVGAAPNGIAVGGNTGASDTFGNSGKPYISK